jgi:hypothetical protein
MNKAKNVERAEAANNVLTSDERVPLSVRKARRVGRNTTTFGGMFG